MNKLKEYTDALEANRDVTQTDYYKEAIRNRDMSALLDIPLPTGKKVAFIGYRNRHYGGPKEGNWWYDSQVIVSKLHFYNEDKYIDKFIKRAQRLIDFCNPGFQEDIGNVNSNGNYVVVCQYETYPANEPILRPSFE